MNRKRVLAAVVVVAVMLVGGITAGTQLLIEQPVSATVTIESLGTSPSFNIIDNPFGTGPDESETAGAAAGYINNQDIYVIDFGKKAQTETGDDWELSFGRSQSGTVGSATDPILYIDNNYAADMSFDAVKTGGRLGKGTRIEVWNNVSIFDVPLGWPEEDELVLTLQGAEDPEDWVLTVNPGHTIYAQWSEWFPESLGIYIKIVNEDAASSPSEGWDPKVKLVVRSD
jgi:hypothetical protein